MRAPHPTLQRLFRLAAVPARCAQAWRESGDGLAALDRGVDGSARDSDERVQALLSPPQIGTGWAAPLDRLTGAGAATAEGGEPEPGRAETGWKAPGGRAPSSASMTMGDAPHRAAAKRPDASRGPAGVPSETAGSCRTAPRWPATVRLTPTSLPDALKSALQAAGRSPLHVTAATAAEHFEARARRAGVMPAWQQGVNLRVSPATEASVGAPRVAAIPTAEGLSPTLREPAAQRAGAPGLPQRMERALGRLAAEASSPAGSAASAARRPPAESVDAPPAAAFALATPDGGAACAAPVTVSGGRIGGFKGLAALGRALGPAAATATASPQFVTAGFSGVPAQPASLDPQAVIDHVESALREQAARGGVSIDGIEP